MSSNTHEDEARPHRGPQPETTGQQASIRANAEARERPVVVRVGTVPQGTVRTRTVRSNSARAMFRLARDSGAATAEYVIATMAAVGFAGLLILILRGDEVRGILTELVRHALTVG